MPSARSMLYAFIASPGGLEAERSAAREVVTEMNSTCADILGWQLELLGWEDTIPGYGRPQEIINRDVDRCDLFIGIVHKRWGQSTGHSEYTSGFEEEFRRAVHRREQTGAPDIIMVFKRIDDSSDPGEQMQRVLAFKTELIDSKSVLFKDLDTLDQWKDHLRKWLYRGLLQRYTSNEGGERATQRALSSEDEEQSTLQLKSAQGTELETLPEQLRDAVSELTTATQSASSFWEIAQSLSDASIIRLHLTAHAILANRLYADPMHVHDVNRIFRDRQSIELSMNEAWQLGRGLTKANDAVAPGWYWFHRRILPAPDQYFVVLATSDSSVAVRMEALQLLALRGKSLPQAIWYPLLRTTLLDESGLIVNAAIDLLRASGTEADAAFLEGLVGDNPGGMEPLRDLAQELRTKQDPRPVLNKPDKGSVITDAELASVRKYAHVIPLATLRKGLKSPHPEVRYLSASELCRRRRFRVADAQQILEDPYRGIRAIALLELARSGIAIDMLAVNGLKPVPQPGQSAGELAWLKIGSQLEVVRNIDEIILEAMRNRSISELEEMIGWYGDSAIAYRAMAETSADVFNHRIRPDMHAKFWSIRERFDERLAVQFGQAGLDYLDSQRDVETEEWTRLRHVEGALYGIARFGVSSDAAFVRPFLYTRYDFVVRAAIVALGTVGNTSDIETLMNHAQNLNGDLAAQAASAAVSLGSKYNLIPSSRFWSTRNPAILSVILSFMYDKGYEVEDAILDSLLLDPNGSVRLTALAYIARALRPEKLAELLTRYHAHDNYYYNVVVWLDRLLYAPAPYVQAFRMSLAAHE